MKVDLKDKVALVSASTEGMGFACAQLYAQSGAKVVILSRNGDKLEKARAELYAA